MTPMPALPPSFPLPPLLLRQLIETALAEDLGSAGDLTTLATIPAGRHAIGTLNARQDGIAAGIEVAATTFEMLDPSLEVDVLVDEGDRLAAGTTLLSVHGEASALLSGERTALNLLGHMCGIATATGALVDAVAGTGAKIACTRKTLPGLRAFQKFAVRCGGGINHRFGLHDAVMIKDNHIIAAGGITPALRAAKAHLGHTVKIEIEVDTLDQLEEVLAEGADIVLLDNMSPDQLRAAVAKTEGRATLEASGNVTVKTVRAIAETGVDVISSGWITHSAPNLDIGMELELA